MTDAHCHPHDLLKFLENAEDERRETGTACASSSWNLEEFEYCEALKKMAVLEAAPPLFLCFALHPQLSGDNEFLSSASEPSGGLELLNTLATEGRLDAVGETGFDLYNEKFKAGEKLQEEMFAGHLEIALRFGLPIVLHVRRAMHKIFPYAKSLKKLPAVVFHSWPGTRGEGEALLRRGINAYFSFGSIIAKNHKEAMACAASFPPDRLLLETDAPYQPMPLVSGHGMAFSSWRDLWAICSCLAALRKKAGSAADTTEELEELTTVNFFGVFSHKPND